MPGLNLPRSREAGDNRAALSSCIYRLFHSGAASKAIAAQHLANTLAKEAEKEGFDRVAFREKLPRYLVSAIAYASGAAGLAAPSVGSGPADDADG